MASVKYKKNKVFLWHRALFPAAVAVCAFICFLIIYSLCINTIDPKFMLLGLLFIIPSLTFFAIAALATKNKLSDSATFIISVVLIPIFFHCSLFYFFNLSMSATTTTVTNVDWYQRTIRLAGRAKKEQLAIFPKKIPAKAKGTVFYFSESVWQEYDQTVLLSFYADSGLITEYTEKCVQKAIRAEIANSTNIANIFSSVSASYVKDLTQDYTVYILLDVGGSDEKVCAVAINPQNCHIVFYAYEMRW